MDSVKDMLLLLISSSIVSNIVLSQFMGLCPFLGVSRKIKTAGYLHRIGIWDQTDQVFRTYLYTFSAGLTLLFVYYGYTVFDVNGIERTYLCAGSISKAAGTKNAPGASPKMLIVT
jgi:hypothetical protein